MAHLCGLGYLGDKKNIQTTMKSIMKYNFVEDFSRHLAGRQDNLVLTGIPES